MLPGLPHRQLVVVVAVFALLALVSAVSGCGEHSGRGSDAAGSIAYFSSPEPDAPGDLLLEDVESNAIERLAPEVRSPSVSADGSVVIFARKGGWWLRLHSAAARRVPVRPEDDDLVLSPDGRTIYFTRVVRGERGYAVAIFAMERDGRGVRQVTRPLVWANGTCDEDPDPLPDGGLAYTRYVDCTRLAEPSIEALGRDGKQVEVLERFDQPGEFRLGDPELSADGDWISFTATRLRPGIGAGRYVAAADGTKAHRVGGGGSAAWSPDSQRLAFADAGDIWIVRRDGTGRRRLTATRPREDVIAWVAAG